MQGREGGHAVGCVDQPDRWMNILLRRCPQPPARTPHVTATNVSPAQPDGIRKMGAAKMTPGSANIASQAPWFCTMPAGLSLR